MKSSSRKSPADHSGFVRGLCTLVIAAALALGASAPATAALLINGEGGTQAPGGRPLHHQLTTSLYSQAARFTLSHDATITGIQTMMAGTRSGAYTISLSKGEGPDDNPNLYSVDLNATFNLALNPCCGNLPIDLGQYMGPMDLNWFVTAGDYWLKYTAPYVGDFAGIDAYIRSGGQYEYMAGADIFGPESYGPFGPDRLAISIYGFAGRGGGAIPEPATWAILILGFGLVGAVLRRRVIAAYCV